MVSVSWDLEKARLTGEAIGMHASKPGAALVVATLLLCGVARDCTAPAATADLAAVSVPAAQPGTTSDWPSYGGTSEAIHYSRLHQIDDRNVNRLGLAWYKDLANMGRSGAPLAVNGVIYFPTGLSEIHAVDASSGRELWHYEPDPAVTVVVGDKMKPGWGIRGIAFWNGKVYAGTQDGRLLAVDAATGKLVWSVQTTEPDDGRYITGPPTTFNGKIIIGNGGADDSETRGYVTTYDAESGNLLWRFYVVPGDPAQGFENDAMAMASKTWTGSQWKKGAGGNPWNALTYDPELNRVYVGTGNGGPWNQKIRSPGGGDNLFTCSIVALDADTGKYLWHFQTTPADTWDYDSTNDIELAQLTIGGHERRVILHAPKNGFFYVIDRDNGQLISAKPFAKVTWAKGIDPKTGRPIPNVAARYLNGAATVWPFANGAHGWQAMSFNPQTGLVYIPIGNLPALMSDEGIDIAKWKRKPGIYLDGGTIIPVPSSVAPDKSAKYGALQAWDPIHQRQVWAVRQRSPTNGGVVSTAGNLVFEGQADGAFVAWASDTGKELWSFDTQNGILNEPITYMAGGRQYVTVVTNFTGTAAIFGPLSEQFGWDYRTQKRRVLTFVLDGAVKLPAAAPHTSPVMADDPAFAVDPNKAKVGVDAFGKNCLICHGPGAIAGGAAPDLRVSLIPLSAEAFERIVRDGALVSAGMPRFAELSATQIDALRHYIRQEARKVPEANASAR